MRLLEKFMKNKEQVLLISLTLLALLSFGVLYTLLQRDEVEAGWWDETWMYRKAIEVVYSGSENLTEYQVLVDNLDTASLVTAGKLQADCDDIRFVSSSGQILDYSIVGNTCNTSETEIWVKIDSIPASNITIYLYYGNSSATGYQSEEKTFSYSTEKTVGYVLQSGVSQLEVISLSASNSISHNGTTLTLGEAQTGSFTSVSQWGGISAKGLFNADSGNNDTDMIVPVSWAGTEFLFYARYTSLTLYALAPWEDATVDVYSNGTGVCTGNTVTSTGATISCTLPATGQVRITSNYPVLIFSKTSSSYDQMPLHPSSAKRWIGGSQSTYFLSNSSGADYRYITSTATSETDPADLAADSYFSSGGGTYGSSPAFLTRSANNPIGVHQQADSDGNDSHMYTLLNEMGTKWGSAVSNTDYISIASDQAATCTVYDTTHTSLGSGTATSSNSSIYFLGFGTGDTNSWTTQKWYMECDAPVAAHYQKNTESESGLWTYPMMRQFTYPTPSINTTGAEEVSPAPIAYWKFDEGTGVVAHDSSGQGNDGSFQSLPLWQTSDKCVSGNCLSFDNIDDGVSISSQNFTSLTDFTMCSWVNPKGDHKHYTGTIMSSGNWNYDYWAFGLNQQNTEIDARKIDGSHSLSWSYNFPLNEWSYVCITRNGTTVTPYVNGKPIGSPYTGSLGNLVSDATNTTIGRETYASGYFAFNGWIDEPKIYAYARTEDQIKSDYAAGLSGIGSTLGVSTTFGDYSPKWMSDGLVGYWKMDESSWNGTTGEVIDHSGNGNHGTGVNGANTSTGKFGNGGSFDGEDDYVSSPNKPNLNQDATLSFWVNKTTSGGDGAVVAGMWDYYGGVVLRDGGRAIIAGGGSAGRSQTSTGAFPEGQYTHIVVTWKDLIPTSFWVDGEQVALETSNSWTAAVDTGLYIGARMLSSESVPSLYFNGSIDEVRIYNRALSPSEVKDLYKWAPGPVAHYTFDSGNNTTLNDISGYGNTGTWNGSTTERYREGKIGKGGVFNGSDDYVETGSNEILNISGALTITAWIKIDSTQNSNYGGVTKYANMTGYPNQRAYGFWFLPNSTTVSVTISDDGTYNSEHYTVLTANSDLGTETWRHVAITFNPSNFMRIYIDGKLDAETTLGVISSIYNSTAPLWLGTNFDKSDPNRYFNGLIDDVRIYNYARTQSQILEDMQSTGGPPTPVGYWKFDEGSGSTANDSSGNSNNGTITGASWINEGRVGKALYFDGGLEDYVSLQAITSLTTGTPFTLSSWVKPEHTGTYRTIMGYGGANRLLINASGAMLSQQDGNFYSASSVVPNGVWTHVIYWFNGTEERWYINGKQSGAAHITSLAEWENSFYIGQYDLANYPYKGLIDEVKIYNTALTPEQVLLDYNQGMTATLSKSPPSIGNIWGGSASSEYCIPGDTSICNPPIGEWLFDENQGSIAKDTSGNGNNGTLVNNPSWSKGKEGSALSFNGSEDYIETSNNNILDPGDDAITYSAWFNTSESSYDTEYGGIVAKRTGANPGVRLHIGNGSTDNKLYGTLYDGSNGTSVASTIAPNDGGWHHGVVVIQKILSGNWQLELFLDGISQGISTNSSGNTINSSEPLRIGRADALNQRYFNGLIDEVRIYNYARTPAQIAWDYNRGAPIGHWRLDECQGTTAHDVSGNNNHGTININSSGTQTSAGTCTSGNTADAWYNGRNGKLNASLNFDGVDDYVDIASEALITNNSYTIAGWINLADLMSSDGIIFANSSNSGDQIIDSIGIKNAQLGWNYISSGAYRAGSTKSFSIGQWGHFVFVSDGGRAGTTKIYINGKEDTITSTDFWRTGDRVQIGARTSGTPIYFNGQIDDVRIYNYALTEEQIKLLYNDNAAVRF